MTITQLAQAIETQEADMAKIGPKEAALQAARADLTIPAALDRTKGMSKADFDKLHDKLGKPNSRVLHRAKDAAYRRVMNAAKPATLTEADKKAIAEIKKAEKAKVEAKKAADAAKRKEEAAEKKAIRDEAKRAKAEHPADKYRSADKAAIAAADHFEVKLLKDGEWLTHKFPTLPEAWDHVKATFDASSRRPLVYAAMQDGSLAIVAPDAPEKPAGKPKPERATSSKAKAKNAPAKPAKAPKAAANGQSKTEIACALLTRKQGATRQEIIEATDWPSINLKAIAKRRKLKLVKNGDVLRFS